jgi:hypothetical protein
VRREPFLLLAKPLLRTGEIVMRYARWIIGGLLVVAGLTGLRAASACGPAESQAQNIPSARCFTSIEEVDELSKLSHQAVSADAAVAESAVTVLRKEGREGLEKFLSVHKEAIDKHLSESQNRLLAGTAAPDENWKRIKTALDTLSGQYDCHASKLFWYTDLEEAKAAAERTGKPILSLRLLGKLTDEFSCANSRFFRSTLYANQEISDVLRERFVLHWQSVRPVPRVTIDFGDGRKLERTLTGNSIHYVLDSKGHVIDALPGLYGPKAFLRGIEAAEQQVVAIKTLDDQQRIASMQNYHRAAAKQALENWQQDLAKLNLLPVAAQTANAPVAQAAKANIASVSKSQAETRILAAALPDPSVLAAASDDVVWGRIAALHQDDAKLDRASIAFMRMQNPQAALAGLRSVSKGVVENPLVRLVRTFQNTIGIDTVKNEYTLHRQLHEWFATAALTPDIDVKDLNERVYAQLFLTPSTDPWLGLVPGNVYTGLNNDGIAQY